MPGTSGRRCMTVMADGVLSDVKHKQKGLQMVIGADYEVKDFTGDVANGTIVVKANTLAVMVGNDHLRHSEGVNVNIAKQVEKLIRQVWIQQPQVQVFVSSLLPRPTQETVSQELVKKANEGISKMCRQVNKYGDTLVKYMPLHQLFLEKWRHNNEKSGKVRISTRVIQPHATYFLLGSDRLNQVGVNLVLEKMKYYVRLAELQGSQDQVKLVDRPGLVVQIDNSDGCTADSEDNNMQPRKAVASGQKLKKGGTKKSFEPKLKPIQGAVALNNQPALCDTSISPRDENEGLKERQNSGKGKTKKEKGSSTVARLVDKWEQLSQGAALDDIDVELGGESLVTVDLGDQVSAQDSEDSDAELDVAMDI